MFKNDKLHRALNKEQKFARQFIIAAILLVLVNTNVIIFVMSKVEVPTAYWVQLAFIPLLLIFMGIYYFRIHKKNIKKIHEDFEREMLKNDDK